MKRGPPAFCPLVGFLKSERDRERGSAVTVSTDREREIWDKKEKGEID